MRYSRSARKFFPKRVNNSSSLNKGRHNRDGISISDLNQQRFLRFYFSVFLVLVSVEKIYQTLKTVSDHISKHLKVCQKYSSTVFSTLFSAFGNVVKHSLSCLM